MATKKTPVKKKTTKKPVVKKITPIKKKTTKKPVVKKITATNKKATYADLVPSLESALKKTGIQDSCYDNQIKVYGSGWNIGHPDGSIGVTFWLMQPVPIMVYRAALKTAKSWAKQNNLIAATSYPNIALNDPTRQQWSNRAAMNAKYIWDFAFYTKEYNMKKYYTEL